MNGFFTEVKIEKSPWQITHQDNILLLGSCFTSEIGQKFELHGFNVVQNPFGTIYNPLSIANLINKSAKKEFFSSEDVIKSGEYYYLYATHSDIRGRSIDDCLHLANNTIAEVNDFLHHCSTIIITLGTAWSYWYQNGNILMANCHKIPQKDIRRRLLSTQEISNALCNMLENLCQFPINVQHCLFTISPVRHIKEGLYDNKLSKSTLNLAVDNVIKIYPYTDYFPSYEIVTDELRDYRFYKSDLIHINETAVDYIWSKFSDRYFSEDTKELNNKYLKLFQMKNHRPFNPESVGYKKHLDKIKQLESELNAINNNLNF